MDRFTNKYSLSKTLRFELKPVGSTLERIKAKGLLKEDEARAEKYKETKKIIDEYHKEFIEKAFTAIRLKTSELELLEKGYEDVKNINDPKRSGNKKNLTVLQTAQRKNIVRAIEKTEGFQNLTKKELIRDDLPAWLSVKYSGEELSRKLELIKDFEKFTTYFTGFHENRKNIYTDEAIPTAIGYRIIHENFPRFCDSCKKISILRERYPELDLSSIERDFSDELSRKSLNEYFTLSNFNNCLSQSGINRFNVIRGGKAGEESKQQGVNEKINLFIQQHQGSLSSAQIKELRYCKLQELRKQIISDRESSSFVLEKFDKDSDLANAIEDFYSKGLVAYKDEHKDEEINILELTRQTVQIVRETDKVSLGKIYIRNDKGLTDISQAIFDDYSLISKALFEKAKRINPAKKQETAKDLERWNAYAKKTNYFSVEEIQSALSEYFANIGYDSEDFKKKKSDSPIADYFFNFVLSGCTSDCFSDIQHKYGAVKNILLSYGNPDAKGIAKHIKEIKEFLDYLQNLLHFLKPLYIEVKGDSDVKEDEVLDKDASFYNDFDFCYEQIRQIIPLYNKCRNYLTQKPYSIEKYKLNFENSTLLQGWDENKESANTSILLRKEGNYYLAVMDKEHNKCFEDLPISQGGKYCYQKIVYKLLPGANKMLPKVFFSDKNIKFFAPSEEILEIYAKECHKKGDSFDLKKCHALIDFFKSSIKKHEDWKNFDFKFTDTKEYKDISEFYKEVEKQGYKISFRDIDTDYIEGLVREGKLYLFQIYNKDFSEHSKGRQNLHTMYWKTLFDEQNLADVVYKLNGKAEIFYRPASIQYSQEVWEKGHHYDILKDKFIKKGKFVPIIKDKRFALDKFSFHVPITINFKALGSSFGFNDEVNRYLCNSPDVHILSIDRGERHLAYYTLIDQKGNIKEQASFNVIANTYKGNEYKKDYHQLLDKVEADRADARENWSAVTKIKDIKEGYLSQVVHKICELVIKHNAIIVFEDLNYGFKRGRFKIEKQVYQKLEKMLIEKLNYLVFKDRTGKQAGSVLNGYQLTAPFTAFKDMGKQTGIIYYVPAYHTSKICPATGFVNLLYPKYESTKQAQDFFKRFRSIRYNKSDDLFEFKFDYKDFVADYGGAISEWTFCSYGDRLINEKNSAGKWETKKDPINLTKEIKKVLNGKVEYLSGEDIKEKISEQDSTQFFKDLMYYLKCTLQMRNSRANTDEDYLISPVRDRWGKFFDSRQALNGMPENADANGAYHIGLKGLMLLHRLDQWDGKNKPNFLIKNEEWYRFIQEKAYKQ